MDNVKAFLKTQGWRVVAEAGDQLTLRADATDIVRGAGRLRRAFSDIGVVLHPREQAGVVLPCAWIEYDVATMRAVVQLVINDSWLPNKRGAAHRYTPPTAITP